MVGAAARLLSLLVAFGVALPAGAGAPRPADRKKVIEHERSAGKAMRERDWERAEREYRAALKLDPLDLLAAYGLGQTMMATRRFAEALATFEACRQTHAELDRRRLSGEQDVDLRRQDQLRALKDDLTYLNSSIARPSPLTLQRIQSQIRELERPREKSGEAEPVPAWLSLSLGSAHFRLDHRGDAEREFLAALSTDPALGEAHNNLGVLYLVAGRVPEAVREIGLAEAGGIPIPQALKDDLAKAAAAPAASPAP